MYSFADVRMLVVDDEELLREILAETFSMYGAQVDQARGGHEALRKLQASKDKPYDLLITDVRMPEGDGLGLLANLQSLDLPPLKIFVCSAYNDLNAQKIRDLNILKVFNKPFQLDDMLRDVFDFYKQRMPGA